MASRKSSEFNDVPGQSHGERRAIISGNINRRLGQNISVCWIRVSHSWLLINRQFSMSSGDDMNMVLLRLVEYLGHTNPLISGFAFDEVGIKHL